ncbi:MAG: hypothetical protein AAFV36_04605 [Myxococcota bacterium]
MSSIKNQTLPGAVEILKGFTAADEERPLERRPSGQIGTSPDVVDRVVGAVGREPQADAAMRALEVVRASGLGAFDAVLSEVADHARHALPSSEAAYRTDLMGWLASKRPLASVPKNETRKALSSMSALARVATQASTSELRDDARREILNRARENPAMRAAWVMVVACAHHGVFDPDVIQALGERRIEAPAVMSRSILHDLARFCRVLGLTKSSDIVSTNSNVYFGLRNPKTQSAVCAKASWRSLVEPMREMSVSEFRACVKGAPLIFRSNSVHKFSCYFGLFSHLEDPEHVDRVGVDVQAIDSGAVRAVPRDTPERSGFYEDNLGEKAEQLYGDLVANDRSIRGQLKDETAAASGHVNGLVEDSGFSFLMKPAEEARFLEVIQRRLFTPANGKPAILSSDDRWIFEHVHQTGFPGPNLKPLTEKFKNGLTELMEHVYDAAEEAGVSELRYRQTCTLSFVAPAREAKLTRRFEGEGVIAGRDVFRAAVDGVDGGELFTSGFFMVPDGQVGRAKTIAELGDDLLTQSSRSLRAEYPRREAAEWLRSVLGSRSRVATASAPVRASVVYPSSSRASDWAPASPAGVEWVATRSRVEQLSLPTAPGFGDVDVLVARPGRADPEMPFRDPNLELVCDLIVRKTIDPDCMSTPIIIDDRPGPDSRCNFASARSVLSALSAQGLLNAEFPLFTIATSDREFSEQMEQARRFVASKPPLRRVALESTATPWTAPKALPRDGRFNVFFAGGHANESRAAISAAKAFGTRAAENGWRVVTGGGWGKGSMGAVYTGWVEHHLKEARSAIAGMESRSRRMTSLQQRLKAGERDGEIDAERILERDPGLVNELSQEGFVPHDLFWCYYTQDLLKMEAPDGQPAPGTTGIDCGNYARRIHSLAQVPYAVVQHGGLGSAHEICRSAEFQRSARVTPGFSFSDGTQPAHAATLVVNDGGGTATDGFWSSLVGAEGLPEERVFALDSHEKLLAETERLAAEHRDWLEPAPPPSPKSSWLALQTKLDAN